MARHRRRIPQAFAEGTASSGGARIDRSTQTQGGPGPEIWAQRLGERFRRVALGLVAALLTARAYWPSEPELREEAGRGLVWVLAVLVAAGIAALSPLVGGRFQFRFSWTDAAVVGLMLLVGLSTSEALDRRTAINLAWEWGGIGLVYLLLRNLPHDRRESSVLAGALVATAVAVSVYGLYQVPVELPRLRERFERNPQAVMQEAGIPWDEQQYLMFRDRLLGSNEPFSTFGLANSLAGFILGPTVLLTGVLIRNVSRRQSKVALAVSGGVALLPLLCLVTCLILTKSRSAYLGFAFGVGALAWQARRFVPRRTLLVSGLTLLLVVALVVAAGLAAGRLDREVLTQSALSLRYRLEYWKATWAMISEAAPSIAEVWKKPTFWRGVGPGNFGHHYLLHKLPESSEEIQDPHNLVLEVWATAGIGAAFALIAALALAFWNLLGPSRASGSGVATERGFAGDGPDVVIGGSGDNWNRTRWLLVAAGLGWVLLLLVGQVNLFADDLFARWLILGVGWLFAVAAGRKLWRGDRLTGPEFGAAVLAVTINLLAAGGIGIPTVALALWSLVALGLNLRDDRRCSRFWQVDGRLAGFALALVWSALAGAFSGAILPYWRMEGALARAEAALARRPPDLERAQAAYAYAQRVERRSPRPLLGQAYLQMLVWQSRGARVEDLRWKTIPVLLLKAASPPRNPNSWILHSERAKVTRELVDRLGSQLPPQEVIRLKASVVEATRTASRLYPTNALLHARLAAASAEVSMFQDAAEEAREALRLDALTPHADKKLPTSVRRELESKLPEWTARASPLPTTLPSSSLQESSHRGGELPHHLERGTSPPPASRV